MGFQQERGMKSISHAFYTMNTFFPPVMVAMLICTFFDRNKENQFVFYILWFG